MPHIETSNPLSKMRNSNCDKALVFCLCNGALLPITTSTLGTFEMNNFRPTCRASLRNTHKESPYVSRINININPSTLCYIHMFWSARGHVALCYYCGHPQLTCKWFIDGLVQERRNSSALAMELRLSCTNLSKWHVEFLLVCLMAEGSTTRSGLRFYL